MSLSLGAALGIAGGSALLNSGLQFLGGQYSQAKQVAAQKDLFDYTWNKANSPNAQVKNLTAAGLNPVAMLGSHGLSEIGSPGGQISPINYQGIGTTDLSGLAQFIAATADAKKKGAEMPGVEAQTQGILLDNDRKRFENDLLKTYGNDKMAAEVALAWQNYNLALQSEDLNEQEIAKRKWEAAKEQALSQVAANQRDILKKELDNKDTEIQLRNEKQREEINTEKSQQSANYASAEQSRSSAEQQRIFNKLYNDERFKHSFMNQAVEAGKQALAARKMTEGQVKHLNYMIEQAAFATDMQEFTYWSNQVNQFVNTVGQAASQFYGAGALRELIQLRKGMGKPSLESGSGYYMQDGLLFKRP